jgi:uncharacterized membrane protein affecting hemolysin expression
MPEGMNVDSRLILIYAAAAVSLTIALILAKAYWKRRLTKWAESQQLQLVSFRGAWFSKAPPPGPAAATSTFSA